MTDNTKIIERLKQYIPQGDGYNSDFANDLSEAVEELEMCKEILDEFYIAIKCNKISNFGYTSTQELFKDVIYYHEIRE